MKFVFELLTAIVWPEGMVLDSTMLSAPVLWVDLEDSANEAHDLLIVLVEIQSDTSVGDATYFVFFKFPVVNNQNKEKCLNTSPKEVGEREAR